MQELRIDPLEELTYAAALQAFVFAYPLYEMARMRAATARRKNSAGELAATNPDSLMRWANEFIHTRALLTAGGSKVVTPNNDTLYTNAWLDLADEPLIIHVPDTNDRYYVLGFLDFYTNPFAHIGRRTTGTGEGLFFVTGPGWKGDVPAGMHHVPCPTNWVWIIGRILVDGEDDLPLVHAQQDQFWIKSWSAYQAGEGYRGKRFDARWDPRVPVGNGVEFFQRLSELLAESPPPSEFSGLTDEWRRAGIFAESSGQKPSRARALERAWKAGREILKSLSGQRDDGAAGPRRMWSHNSIFGETFGADCLKRAHVAFAYIGALTGEEAMYFLTNRDASGDKLNGGFRYRLHFEAGNLPPVDCFWSLTMYDQSDFMLVANPINRFSIGDRTRDIKYGPDGSLGILLQHDLPPLAERTNWLPAPAGDFYLVLRAYQPKPALIDDSYRVPPVARI